MDQEQAPQQQAYRISIGTALGVGFIAGLIMTLFLVALRFAFDTPVVLELVADWLTVVTPAVIFDFLLERLQVAGKPIMFAGLLLGQVLMGTGLGVLYARYYQWLPWQEHQWWQRGLLIAAVLWLGVMVVVMPLVGGGFFGISVTGGPQGYYITTFLALAAFGLSLTHFHHIAMARGERVRGERPHSLGRREFIQRAAFFAVLAAGGAFAVRSLFRGAASLSPSRVFPRPGLSPEVTPIDRFYEVSKNIINPNVEVATWKLEIFGDIGNPYTLTYDELLALPWQEEYVTLTCISNRIGGDLIGNALWRGVPLKLLLERAELPASAERLAFHAADGYIDSFPVDYAMRDDVMVAYLMNGEPLNDKHGFPARIIVPGLYGMENVKWLTGIEMVAADFRGYWQQRGWADTAVIRTMSRIDVPAADLQLGETLVGGVAFAGDRGVSKVEFSLDNGQTWQPAKLSNALSPYTWLLWTEKWTPTSLDSYNIAVRATDGTGEIQTAKLTSSLPNGATGYHRRTVTAREAERADTPQPG